MKLLQLQHKVPFPLNDGGAISLYNSSNGLTRCGVELKVLAINTPKNWVKDNEIPDSYIALSSLETINVDTRIKPLHAFKNLFSTDSYLVERFYSKVFESRLVQILHEQQFDVVQLEHSYMCLYIKAIREHSNAKIILRPQNVEHLVWSRYIRNQANPLKSWILGKAISRLRIFEGEMALKVDGIMAISDLDTAFYSLIAPGIPLVTIAAGFDFTTVKNLDLEKQYASFPVFYHLGSMDWLPNLEGIHWFIGDVIPCIRKECPDFNIRLAGKKMPADLYQKQNASLQIDGEVEDKYSYQEDKAIMIVPLLSGGGLRIKIIEGMAMGKTIISTSVGAEGIPYINGENILIANTREEFTYQVHRCYHSQDLCRKIGNNARLLAEEHYNNDHVAKKMFNFLQQLIN